MTDEIDNDDGRRPVPPHTKNIKREENIMQKFLIIWSTIDPADNTSPCGHFVVEAESSEAAYSVFDALLKDRTWLWEHTHRFADGNEDEALCPVNFQVQSLDDVLREKAIAAPDPGRDAVVAPILDSFHHDDVVATADESLLCGECREMASSELAAAIKHQLLQDGRLRQVAVAATAFVRKAQADGTITDPFLELADYFFPAGYTVQLDDVELWGSAGILWAIALLTGSCPAELMNRIDPIDAPVDCCCHAPVETWVKTTHPA